MSDTDAMDKLEGSMIEEVETRMDELVDGINFTIHTLKSLGYSTPPASSMRHVEDTLRIFMIDLALSSRK